MSGDRPKSAPEPRLRHLSGSQILQTVALVATLAKAGSSYIDASAASNYRSPTNKPPSAGQTFNLPHEKVPREKGQKASVTVNNPTIFHSGKARPTQTIGVPFMSKGGVGENHIVFKSGRKSNSKIQENQGSGGNGGNGKPPSSDHDSSQFTVSGTLVVSHHAIDNHSAMANDLTLPYQVNRPRESRSTEEIQSVQPILNILKQIGLTGDVDTLKRMLFNTPASLSAIQEYGNQRLIESIFNLRGDDLKILLEGDIANMPIISSLIEAASLAQDELPAFELLSESITEFAALHDLKFDANFFQDLSHNLYETFKDFLPAGLTLATIFPFLKSQLSTIEFNLKKLRFKKIDSETRNRLIFIGILTTLLVASCSTAAPPTLAAPTIPPPATQEPIASPIPLAVENATAIATADQNLPSLYFPNLYLGRINGNPFGEITAVALNSQNPDYIFADNQTVSRHVIYYSVDRNNPDQPEVLRGFGLDNQYLIDVFNASFDKDNILAGTLPDGIPVIFKSGFWQYNRNGQNYYLLANVANLEGEYIGYPILVADKATQKNLYRGLVADQNAKLLDGTSFSPAFTTAADIARNLGYSGDVNLIASISYDANGNIVLKDVQGNTLSTLPYLDPYAPPPPEPTPTQALSPQEQLELDVGHLVPKTETCLRNRDLGINLRGYVPTDVLTAELKVHATGKTQTIPIPMGKDKINKEVTMMQVVYRVFSGDLAMPGGAFAEPLWLPLGGNNFGEDLNGDGKPDGLNIFWFSTPEGGTGQWVTTIDTILQNIPTGLEIRVQIPIKNTTYIIENRPFDEGATNELANEALRRFEANKDQTRLILECKSVSPNDNILWPLQTKIGPYNTP